MKDGRFRCLTTALIVVAAAVGGCARTGYSSADGDLEAGDHAGPGDSGAPGDDNVSPGDSWTAATILSARWLTTTAFVLAGDQIVLELELDRPVLPGAGAAVNLSADGPRLAPVVPGAVLGTTHTFAYTVVPGDSFTSVAAVSPISPGDALLDATGGPADPSFVPPAPLVVTAGSVPAPEWGWVGGTQAVGAWGTIAGAPGERDPTFFPGPRWRPLHGLGADGLLWLMGGSANGIRSDLWSFDPAAGQWARHLGGDAVDLSATYPPATPEAPAARNAAMLLPRPEGVWLMGGLHFAPAPVSQWQATNGLWRHDATANAWTHTGGRDHYNEAPPVYGALGVFDAANQPGARYGHGNWIVGDRLWVYGGYGVSASGNALLSDLWELDLATGRWCWVGGPNDGSSAFATGTRYLPSPTTWPRGVQDGPAAWTTHNGDLWLFGSRSGGSLQADLWRFDAASRQWAWMGGPGGVANAAGIYGTRGVPSAGSWPGARLGPLFFTDALDRLWLFGGDGFDSAGTRGYLNDLWVYHVASDQWVWVSGADNAESGGTFGPLGELDLSYAPPAREGGAAWVDPAGADGGWIFAGDSTAGIRGDLWRLRWPSP